MLAHTFCIFNESNLYFTSKDTQDKVVPMHTFM